MHKTPGRRAPAPRYPAPGRQLNQRSSDLVEVDAGHLIGRLIRWASCGSISLLDSGESGGCGSGFPLHAESSRVSTLGCPPCCTHGWLTCLLSPVTWRPIYQIASLPPSFRKEFRHPPLLPTPSFRSVFFHAKLDDEQCEFDRHLLSKKRVPAPPAAANTFIQIGLLPRKT